MRIHIFIVILCLTIIGCGNDFIEHELDEKSFDVNVIMQIERETGIDLPDGAKGLKYHYIPPVDPIIFAKIEISAEQEKVLAGQIEGLKNISDFPKGFANDRCEWWPSNNLAEFHGLARG